MAHADQRPEDAAFAAALRRLREERRMTVAELAEAAGINRNTLYLLEAGGRAPRWHNACALADALGVSVEAFRDTA